MPLLFHPARRRARNLSALALGLLLVTACSGDGNGGSSAPQSSGSPSAASLDGLVRASGIRTAGAGSSKFAVTSSTSVGAQEIVFAGEGSFDYVARTGSLTFEVPGAGADGGPGAIEQRVIGPDLFLSLPKQPVVFYKLMVSDVAATPLGNSIDPTAVLQTLAAVTTVRSVGPAQVRGVETTRYAGEYDAKAALDQAQGSAKTILQTALAGSDVQKVPFDVYVDDRGRLVKFDQRIEVPASPQNGGQIVTSALSVELFEFGFPVTVAAPAPETVRDGAPLLAQLRATGPAPVPSPAAPAPPVDPAAPPPAPVDPALVPPVPPAPAPVDPAVPAPVPGG
jgi:hypothetical protein